MPVKSRLEEVGVLELLKDDDRPSFVLEGDTSLLSLLNTQIVFRNEALATFVQAYSKAYDFENWARTLPVSRDNGKKQTWDFGGRAWASTLLQNRWLLVYCSQQEHVEAVSLPDGVEHDEANRSVALADSATASAVSPDNAALTSHPVKPSWPDLMGDSPTSEPKILDWTRYHLEELSPYCRFLKEFDFSASPLGPMATWPNALRRHFVGICSNPEPRVILWGERNCLVYNEAAVCRIGYRHPAALGMPAAETFHEIWAQLTPMVHSVLFEGKSTKVVKELAFMERNGILEETYWNFVMSPMVSESGYAEGLLDSFTEQTSNLITQRRRDIVANLAHETASISTLKELWPAFTEGFGPFGVDIPFAIVYALDDADCSTNSSNWSQQSRTYALEATLGIGKLDSGLPQLFDLDASIDTSVIANCCRNAWDIRQTVVLHSEDGTLPAELSGAVPGRGWGDPIRTVCVMPIATTTTGALGFLIIALNPRRPFNEDSLRFAHNLRDILAKPAWSISQQKFEEMHDNLAHQLKVSTLEAARNEEKFTRLAEDAPLGICTFDRDGRTLYINDHYLDLVGISREYEWSELFDRQNHGWRDEVKPEDIPIIAEAWRKLINREATSVSIEYRLKRPWRSMDKATGEVIIGETWLLNKATVELDDEDNVSCIHAWLLDVSHQHYAERLMAQRLEEAMENKRKSENFIDMVSHELRNPLSAILQSADEIATILEAPGEVEMAKRKTLRETVMESAQTIILCAQHQKCIVDDILTLSKLDSNLLVITPDKVQPSSLVEKVIKMYDAELARSGVEAKLEIESSYTTILGHHDRVMLDPSRLLQVIINLFTNAIKFTQYQDKRKVTVLLGASWSEPVGASENMVFIQPRARREHKVCSSDQWGSGEDLFIKVTVRDTGRGLSNEEVNVLFERFSQASPKTYQQYGGSGLGLFISRELTELQGGQIGVSSQGLGNGSTFAFYVRARRCPLDKPDDSPPLPLRHVLRAPQVAGADVDSIPSSATPRGRLRSSRIPTRTKPSIHVPEEEIETRNAPMHVLVVEDNLINQKVMARQLRRVGFVVHIANHGLECLSFLQKTPFWNQEMESPDLGIPVLPPDSPSDVSVIPLSVVLLDWEMPTMDGLTCVREIRKLQASGHIVSHVPVIAVTANARGEQISIAMEAGMDDIVTKPFRISELVPRMEALVAKHMEVAAQSLDAYDTCANGDE